MADIVMADDGPRFDGATRSHGPLGGAETAFVSLAEALAARGHAVRVANNCAAPVDHAGVAWRPLSEGVPERADLYIANRSSRLIGRCPGARRRVFWIHNPADYLLKPRFLWPLWRHRPLIVFSGPYHASTYPAWAPDGGRVEIGYGVEDVFRTVEPAPEPPPPRALFVSNPMRGLDWVLKVWVERIHPRLPQAELHVFSGPQTYRGGADGARMRPILSVTAQLGEHGVVLRPPVSKTVLAEELRSARVLLYRGDPGETFCLAVAEAQAAGVPAVVQPIGCLAERVAHGETGFVAADAATFAAAAIGLLSDDAGWQACHEAALRRQRGRGWGEAAAAFAQLIPESAVATAD